MLRIRRVTRWKASPFVCEGRILHRIDGVACATIITTTKKLTTTNKQQIGRKNKRALQNGK